MRILILAYLNTSYVMVHPKDNLKQLGIDIDLNTSYVMVHPKDNLKQLGIDIDLNTSYVMVHPTSISARSAGFSFKYILCYGFILCFVLFL